jgi:hypothetical protein
VPHKAEALEDTLDVDVFDPPRQDWLDGTDHYFRTLGICLTRPGRTPCTLARTACVAPRPNSFAGNTVTSPLVARFARESSSPATGVWLIDQQRPLSRSVCVDESVGQPETACDSSAGVSIRMVSFVTCSARFWLRVVRRTAGDTAFLSIGYSLSSRRLLVWSG